jgi:hypothetical protein
MTNDLQLEIKEFNDKQLEKFNEIKENKNHYKENETKISYLESLFS